MTIGSRSTNNHRPHHVYRIFADDGTLLYIGCTEDVEHRLYMHETNRWTNAASYGIDFCGGIGSHDFTTYPDKATARKAEREAIREQKPLINRHHNPTRWHWVDGEYVMADETTAEVGRLAGARRAKIQAEVAASGVPSMAEILDSLTQKATA